jgi:hypothetical protein
MRGTVFRKCIGACGRVLKFDATEHEILARRCSVWRRGRVATPEPKANPERAMDRSAIPALPETSDDGEVDGA